MTALAESALEGIDFAKRAADHQHAVLGIDGYRSATLELRFSGSGKLDPTSADDVALLYRDLAPAHGLR